MGQSNHYQLKLSRKFVKLNNIQLLYVQKAFDFG